MANQQLRNKGIEHTANYTFPHIELTLCSSGLHTVVQGVAIFEIPGSFYGRGNVEKVTFI